MVIAARLDIWLVESAETAAGARPFQAAAESAFSCVVDREAEVAGLRPAAASPDMALTWVVVSPAIWLVVKAPI